MLLEFSRKDNHYRLLKYLAHVLSAAMLDVFIIDLGTQFTCLTGTKVQILTQSRSCARLASCCSFQSEKKKLREAFVAGTLLTLLALLSTKVHVC